MSEIAATLAERGKRYGDFMEQADLACAIKSLMRTRAAWRRLRPDQVEALEMIAIKIARLLCGDPDYIDNWTDIAGYATLVEQRLTRDQQKGGT